MKVRLVLSKKSFLVSCFSTVFWSKDRYFQFPQKSLNSFSNIGFTIYQVYENYTETFFSKPLKWLFLKILDKASKPISLKRSKYLKLNARNESIEHFILKGLEIIFNDLLLKLRSWENLKRAACFFTKFEKTRKEGALYTYTVVNWQHLASSFLPSLRVLLSYSSMKNWMFNFRPLKKVA